MFVSRRLRFLDFLEEEEEGAKPVGDAVMEPVILISRLGRLEKGSWGLLGGGERERRAAQSCVHFCRLVGENSCGRG